MANLFLEFGVLTHTIRNGETIYGPTYQPQQVSLEQISDIYICSIFPLDTKSLFLGKNALVGITKASKWQEKEATRGTNRLVNPLHLVISFRTACYAYFCVYLLMLIIMCVESKNDGIAVASKTAEFSSRLGINILRPYASIAIVHKRVVCTCMSPEAKIDGINKIVRTLYWKKRGTKEESYDVGMRFCAVILVIRFARCHGGCQY